jgi:hypothetical protein
MKNPFRRKQVTRGPSKSAQQKLKEAEAATDLKLHGYFDTYLRDHPTVAQEIAMKKFGLDFGGGEREEYPFSNQPDVMEMISQYKAMKEAFADEFGGDKAGGLTGLLKDFLHSDKDGALAQALAGLLTGMAQGIQNRPQLPPGPKPQPEPQPETTEEEIKQTSVVQYIQHLTSMKPEDAAQEIASNREVPEDLRSIVFNYATSVPFNDLMAQLQEVCPPYLVSVLNRIPKTWLAAVYDELNNIKQAEEGGKSKEKRGKKDETHPEHTD